MEWCQCGLPSNLRTSTRTEAAPMTRHYLRPGEPALVVLAGENARDERRLAFRVGLTVVAALPRQPKLQILIGPCEPCVAPQRIPEPDLVVPPPVPGLDEVQVRRTPLPGRVRLHEEP